MPLTTAAEIHDISHQIYIQNGIPKQVRITYEKVLGGFDAALAAGEVVLPPAPEHAHASFPWLTQGPSTGGGPGRRGPSAAAAEGGARRGAAPRVGSPTAAGRPVKRQRRADGSSAEPSSSGEEGEGSEDEEGGDAGDHLAHLDPAERAEVTQGGYSAAVQHVTLTAAAEGLRAGDRVEVRLPEGAPHAQALRAASRWTPARVVATAPGTRWEGTRRFLVEYGAPPATNSADGAAASTVAARPAAAGSSGGQQQCRTWLPLVERGPWRRPYSMPRLMIRLPQARQFGAAGVSDAVQALGAAAAASSSPAADAAASGGASAQPVATGSADAATVARDDMIFVPTASNVGQRISISMLRGKLKPSAFGALGIESYSCMEHARAAATAQQYNVLGSQ